MAATAATVEVVVPPLLSLVLARHRFDEIQPNTVADLLIALLWDRLASGRYLGPSLATVLRRRRRRGRRACPTNLSALDSECHTLLALCKPPPSSTPAHPSPCPFPTPSAQHSMEGDGELLAKRALSDNQPGELAVLCRHQLAKRGVHA